MCIRFIKCQSNYLGGGVKILQKFKFWLKFVCGFRFYRYWLNYEESIGKFITTGIVIKYVINTNNVCVRIWGDNCDK